MKLARRALDNLAGERSSSQFHECNITRPVYRASYSQLIKPARPAGSSCKQNISEYFK